jgi:hypothetical protein
MILAAMMTGVLFFPGAWVPSALALSRPGRPAFPAAGRRRRSKTQGGAPATLTDWPMTARGSLCGRLW